jgi:hypothetical protein
MLALQIGSAKPSALPRRLRKPHGRFGALRIYAHLFRKRDDKAAAVINAALAGFGPGC